MRRLISPGRLIFMAVITAGILGLYVSKLYKLQIIEGNANYEASINSIVSEEAVIAARGNMLDRYGRLLVSNRNCNDLLINEDDLFYSDRDDNEINAIILRMCSVIEENGDSYVDQLPITMTPPFEYTSMSDWQATLLNAWIENQDLDPSASAVEVMAAMRTRYGIDGNYSAAEMRKIAGVRYEVNVRYVVPTSSYVFAKDVSINTISSLMEADIPGFEVQVGYQREYNTTYAGQILGYTGSISSTQMKHYVDELGYPMDAVVGQAGAESAFEELLHGTDGVAEITRTSEGVVTSTVYSKAPQPGNHVYLTIDLEMQALAESILANYIETVNEAREAENRIKEARFEQPDSLISGGAIVAVDVRNGEPLCIASYPTYNPATFWDHYTELYEDESRPLFNRALMGMYAPGSTFKPCVALAGLCEGIIGVDSTYACTGQYTVYPDYQPYCTGVHGGLTVSDAITVSCNYFFFSLGDAVGIDLIDKYAALLGLGEYTGIELDESKGNVASPAVKAAAYAAYGPSEQGWYKADNLLAAIGQSVTGITPIQLARYAAALANGGKTYSCSILKAASSYDYSESVAEREPEVMSEVEANETIWNAIHTGMYGSANEYRGTAYSTFGGFEPTVASKTGTTQTGNNGVNDAFFICYAPYEDPEIAVAVALERGTMGANLADLARQVLEYYFDFQQRTQLTEDELTLLH